MNVGDALPSPMRGTRFDDSSSCQPQAVCTQTVAQNTGLWLLWGKGSSNLLSPRFLATHTPTLAHLESFLARYSPLR